jgi:hypothetical protein
MLIMTATSETVLIGDSFTYSAQIRKLDDPPKNAPVELGWEA